jgi:hypothetical protein
MKKGYMKTLEVLFAIVVTIMFFVILIPQQNVSENQEDNLGIMESMIKDPVFREGVISLNKECYDMSDSNSITQTVEKYLLEEYAFYICIDRKKGSFPEKRIFVESAFITGNITDYKQREVWLYYWVS